MSRQVVVAPSIPSTPSTPRTASNRVNRPGRCGGVSVCQQLGATREDGWIRCFSSVGGFHRSAPLACCTDADHGEWCPSGCFMDCQRGANSCGRGAKGFGSTARETVVWRESARVASQNWQPRPFLRMDGTQSLPNPAECNNQNQRSHGTETTFWRVLVPLVEHYAIITIHQPRLGRPRAIGTLASSTLSTAMPPETNPLCRVKKKGIFPIPTMTNGRCACP